MTPHTAGRAESPRGIETTALLARYAEARRRLYGPPPRVVRVARRELPKVIVVAEDPKPARRERDFIFIKPRAAGTRNPRACGTWLPLEEEIIIHETAKAHRVSVEATKSYAKARNVVAARYEIFYRLNTELFYSTPMIGKVMGGRDHSGVLHGLARHKAKLEATGQ